MAHRNLGEGLFDRLDRQAIDPPPTGSTSVQPELAIIELRLVRRVSHRDLFFFPDRDKLLNAEHSCERLERQNQNRRGSDLAVQLRSLAHFDTAAVSALDTSDDDCRVRRRAEDALGDKAERQREQACCSEGYAELKFTLHR